MSSLRRVALIGAGEIGRIRAEAIERSAFHKLAIVCDVRQEAAAELASGRGALASTEWERVVSSPDIDLVVVSTPPDLHAGPAIAAMEHGKDVLCEKPLAHTLDAAAAMCEAAERHHVRLHTGFNHRFFPAMKFARSLIESHSIGEVIGVKAYAGHPGGSEFGHAWVHEGSVTGGGSLVDNGIHILDLARYLGGEVRAAKGYAQNLLWKFDSAEDNAMALFRREGAGVTSVHASWTDSFGYRFSVELTGSRGYVKAAYPPMRADWGITPGPGTRAKRHTEWFPLFQLQERMRSWRWTIVQSFVDELKAIEGHPRDAGGIAATGRDGLRSMEMAHAVYRSSREGSEVAL